MTYAQPSGATTEHPEGTKVLILGILSLVICGLLGPFAWVSGNRVLGEIDQSGGRYSNRSAVNAGRICGMVASILLVVGLVVGVIFGVLAATNSDSSALGL
jgi:phosphotransferase system  glucose/maltose/N-acetylglucosamine-specific IIC component